MMPPSDLPWWVSVPLFLIGTAAAFYQRRQGLMAWLGVREVDDE